MSKNQMKYAIECEIRKLNEVIDMKIVRGQSYRHEARRHKMLVAQVKRMKGQQWFANSFGFMHLF